MVAPRFPDRRVTLRRISVALLLLLLVLAAAAGYWWYSSPRAVLVGQVVAAGPLRQTLAGAEVSVVGTRRSVRTDAHGRYHLNLLPAGTLHIKVAAPGYEETTIAADLCRGDDNRLDVALSPGRILAARGATAIRGEVLEMESGRPLSGVKVRIPGSSAAPVYTGIDGSFQFTAIRENQAEIEADAPGYRKTTASWIAGAKPLSIRLPGGASLAGKVVAAAYERPMPIAGASVRLAGSARTATTDQDGRFQLDSLVGGRSDVQVTVLADGYEPCTVNAALPQDGAVLPDIGLSGSAAASGAVSDRLTGKPIAGVSVCLRATRLKTQTGLDGKFALAAVPPGSQVLGFSRSGFHDAEVTATIIAGDNRTIDVALSGAHSLRGRVVWDGPEAGETRPMPIGGAMVFVKGTDSTAKGDAQGRFALGALPPETVALVVKAPGFLTKEVSCDATDASEKTIRLHGDSIASGRVVDTNYEPPRPVAGATVRLADSPLTARSDAKGRFILDGASSGAARLAVAASGYIPCELTQRLEQASPIGLATLPCQATVRWTELLWLMGAASPLHGLTFISTAQRSTSAPTTRDTTVLTDCRPANLTWRLMPPALNPCNAARPSYRERTS